MADLVMRPLVKTISWRAIATFATTIITFLFLRDLAFSTALAITTDTIKRTAYFLYEPIWDEANWGRSSE